MHRSDVTELGIEQPSFGEEQQVLSSGANVQDFSEAAEGSSVCCMEGPEEGGFFSEGSIGTGVPAGTGAESTVSEES
eukprot:CAMPEP_0196212828 /NCGR_PEP_ID=MMETSP0912-20130531/22770_1 /TAXON_ID=49265 /ORGANISM="Thalassiosira rotula, Strain GSO102" /LENGTH=76 /DNA_ID=CAMNT_0041488899 /DNA_START=71 /DNA_END=298 /DNA_ORIENTATION=-